MTKYTIISFALLLLVLGGCTPGAGSNINDREPFNDGWRFHLQTQADSADLAAPGFDDSQWRALDLPHDWAIEGTFSQDNPSGTGGGALPGGIGWYRKSFTTPADMKPGDRLFVDFDGAYMNTSVYVNGHLLGTRPYGYASFSHDITDYLAPDGRNVIAVRVDNAEQPNSRWYSGCGIYRNVWLRHTAGVFVPLWGQHIIADVNATGNGIVSMQTDITNTTDIPRDLTVESRIFTPDGKEVAKTVSEITVPRDTTVSCGQNLTVPTPLLWSTESPNLYRVQTRLVADGKTTGVYETKTGFRTLAFDAEKGFSLNGKRMKIRGVCLHHDAGALGAVVNRRAIERQLEIMKEMGANAIRVSHNPPAPELLDLCDSMGMLVMDETFDMWRKKKTEHDYARYFNDWHERDLTDLIRRDRNHPSVFMWSIGNEVLEQWSHADADTLSLEQANLILNFGHGKEMLAHEDSAMSVNSLLTRKLADMVRELDAERPITAGCNEPAPGNHLFRANALDVIGYNYHDEWFKDVPVNFPSKPFIVTESVSGLMTRGYYRMPSDSMYIWPERWDKPFHDESFACSSYDNCHVPWGSTHEKSMYEVENNDFISGQFVWTGFDYLGEPTPFGWPARSSYFGIVDLAGIPKDIYYMYQSQWRPDKTVLHLFPHWNWEPGQEIDMWTYYNNADEVELFVNGESQGIRRPEKGVYHAAWRVRFIPGTVEAVSRKNGREVARTSISTAGEPYAVKLTPDRCNIHADGKDLSYLTVEILDKDGNLCPLADNEVCFEVSGAGFNAGVDNGSPVSLEPFKSDRRKAFYGKAMLIVQSDGKRGDIRVTATSPRLKNGTATLTAK